MRKFITVDKAELPASEEAEKLPPVTVCCEDGRVIRCFGVQLPACELKFVFTPGCPSPRYNTRRPVWIEVDNPVRIMTEYNSDQWEILE